MSRRQFRLFRSVRNRRAGDGVPQPASPTLPRLRWIAVGAVMASTAIVARSAPAYAAGPPPGGRAAWIGASTNAGQSTDPRTRTFDLAAGPLASVLEAFEAATSLTVIVDPARTEGLSSPGVVGTFTVAEALRRVLANTTLVAQFVDARTVLVDAAVTEFVEVSGRTAPRSAQPVLTEPLRDVPQTITVVPAAVIEEQGASSLRDVLRNVVGLTFQAGEGGVPAGDQMTIRGFSARTDMFIDGVRDFGGYSRDPYNVEQVEIAKGPSSAIAGRGSTGGAINLMTKAPNLETGYHTAFSGGNADYRRTTVDINQPLPNASVPGVALRLNAMYTDTGVPGRDVVRGERWGVSPSLAIGLGTPTRLTASFSHLDQDNVPEYGLPWVPANSNPDLAAYANSKPPVDQSNFYGLRARDYENTATDIGTIQIDHQAAPGLGLRNLTRYGKTSRDSVITAPRFASVNTSTAITRQLQSRDMVDDIFANQTSVTARFGTIGLAHAVVGGLEVVREGSENYLRTGPAAPLADLFHPDPNEPYVGPIARTGARNTGSASSAAAYAFDTVNIGSRLELSGGLRWDRFDVDYESRAATGEITAFERADRIVSWRAGAVYKPQVNGSVYFGYGLSFNPSAEGLALTAATVSLEPEQTRTYETGTKWDLAGEQLSVTAAFFRTEKTNARTPGINPGDPPTVLTGRLQVSGLELGASGRITPRWTAFAGYSFMHSDIAASNTATDVDNEFALTPNHTLSVWTTFQLPWNVTVGGGTQYMDAVFRNTANSAVVPGYWLINGLASYEVNQHLTLRFNVMNLTNERYVDRVGGGHYIPGPGRSLQISSAVGF